MESFVITLVSFVFVIGVLVFIHEAGHFSVAKLFNVEVETFSLGFGPRLFGFKKGGTEYRVSAVPLGGYVKMLGENPDEMEEAKGLEGALVSKPGWQRFLIFVAGPAANILLAILIPAAIYVFNYEVPAYKLEPARVGFVAIGSPAEKAGVQPGDFIVRFGDEENPTWTVVEYFTSLKPGQRVPIVVERGGQRGSLNLELGTRGRAERAEGVSGMLPDLPGDGVGVRQVQDGTPAAKGGLRAGDKIVSIDGQPVKYLGEELAIVGSNVGRPLKFRVLRGGQMVELTIAPFFDPALNRGAVGFIPEPYIPPMVSTRLGPVRALKESVQMNLLQLMVTKEAFREIFAGHRSVRDTFSGPVGIAAATAEAARQGMEPFLMMMAFVSLSLGIFNLFPIPILDGGQVLMLALEKGFQWFGGELSVSWREKIQTIGFTVIVLLMGYIIYTDIAKLIQ